MREGESSLSSFPKKLLLYLYLFSTLFTFSLNGVVWLLWGQLEACFIHVGSSLSSLIGSIFTREEDHWRMQRWIEHHYGPRLGSALTIWSSPRR